MVTKVSKINYDTNDVSTNHSYELGVFDVRENGLIW